MEKEWVNGYKVCKREGNRLISCFMGSLPKHHGGFKIYGIGRITKRTPGYIRGIVSRLRKHGPLAVFRFWEDAARFIDSNWVDGIEEEWPIYKCRYIESRDADLWYPGYRQRNLIGFRISGTYYADEVELIEEVGIGA